VTSKPTFKFKLGERVIVDWDVDKIEIGRVTVLGPPERDPNTQEIIYGVAFEYSGWAKQYRDEQGDLVPARLTATVLMTPDQIARKINERWNLREPNDEYLSAIVPYKMRFDQGGKNGYLFERAMIKVRDANEHLIPPAVRKLLKEK
jgi:hypothetical protein